MTEIEKKAEEVVSKYKYDYRPIIDIDELKAIYKNGYEQGQKDTFQTYNSEVNEMSNDYSYRLKQLEKEIEKMKCCENCKWNFIIGDYEPYLDRANKYWYQNTNIIGLYSKESELDVKNAYIDGLAEGRKELEQCKQDLQIAIDTNKKWLQRDTQLEEENEELKKQIEEYKIGVTERNNEIKDFMTQIEKMKNCQNCKNKKRNTTCSFCFKLDKWELCE